MPLNKEDIMRDIAILVSSIFIRSSVMDTPFLDGGESAYPKPH